VILEDGSLGHQRGLILGVRCQHCFVRRKLGFDIGGEFIVRRRRDIGFVQAARHADAIVLLAGGGHTQGLRQSAGARRLLGYFAGFHFRRFGIQTDFTRRRQCIE
jgi:hypothetical protein